MKNRTEQDYKRIIKSLLKSRSKLLKQKYSIIKDFDNHCNNLMDLLNDKPEVKLCYDCKHYLNCHGCNTDCKKNNMSKWELQQ